MSASNDKAMRDAPVAVQVATSEVSTRSAVSAKIEELTGCASTNELFDKPELWPDLITELNFLTGKPPMKIRYDREQPLRAFDEALGVIKRYGARIGVMVFAGKFVRPALKARPGIRARRAIPRVGAAKREHSRGIA